MPNSTTLIEDSRRRGSVRKAWLVPLILGAAALTLALVIRYVWIESTEIGLACAATPAPWWCEPRYIVIRTHQLDVWGLVALAAGLISLVTRWYWLALVALVVGLLGLVLYNTGLAAVGLLAGLLLIVRR
ncbi:hypothetical protein [Dongia sp. agr-C8]